jgi:hypothetical protein
MIFTGGIEVLVRARPAELAWGGRLKKRRPPPDDASGVTLIKSFEDKEL